MARWLYFLIPFGAVALVMRSLGAPHELVFVLAALGIVPLSGLIGVSTEDLAHKIGPKWGGLLTATMGNAGELLIGFAALQQGLLALVKASITGSIIGNILLVLGTGLLVSGLRYGRLTFDPHEAGRHGTMMVIAVASLILPAIFHLTGPSQLEEAEVSIGVSVLLLLVYAAYLLYSLHPDGAKLILHEGLPAPEELERKPWSPGLALGVLTLATIGTGILAEVLVGTIETVSHSLHLSEFFVGLIVVPLVGNVAEHFSAIQLAAKRKIDLSLAIAAGSSTQIALFAAPVLVLGGIILGQPMDYVFLPLEIVTIAVSAILFSDLSGDGESNWFEAVQLLAMYGMAAVVAFFTPLTGAVH